MAFTFNFIRIFSSYLIVVSPILVYILLQIITLGLIVARIEKWNKINGIYWAMITGLTVGYGDMVPKQKSSKLIAIIIALSGLVFSGIFVALSVEAARRSFVN